MVEFFNIGDPFNPKSTSLNPVQPNAQMQEAELRKKYQEELAAGTTDLPWELYKQTAMQESVPPSNISPGTSTPVNNDFLNRLRQYNSIIAPQNGANPNGSLKINLGSEQPWQTPNDNIIQEQNINMAQDVHSDVDPFPYSVSQPETMGTDKPITSQSNNLSFLDYLSTIPGIGGSIAIDDKFRIAGQSLAYDSSYIQDPKKRRQANTVNALTGAAAIGSGILQGVRSGLSGFAAQKRNNYVAQGYLANLKRMNDLNYTYGKAYGSLRDGGNPFDFFENGGTKDIFSASYSDLMLDENLYSLPPALVEGFATAEVEDDEWIKSLRDDKIRKAEGNTHEEGGIKVALLPGDSVLSDNLKLTPTQAKECSEKYNIKLKPSMTYAETVDAYSRKLGIDDINEEIKDLYKKIEKLGDLEDEPTKAINLAFLQKKLIEKEQLREPLLEQRKAFYDAIFVKQEEAKLPSFKKGGTFSGSNLDALCKKHGLSKEEGMKLLESYEYGGKKKKKIPYYENGTPPDWKLVSSVYNNYDDFNKQKKTGSTYGKVGSELQARMAEIAAIHPEEYAKYLAGDNYKDPKNIEAYQNAINSKYNKYIKEAEQMYGVNSPEVNILKADISQEAFTTGVRAVDSKLGNFTSSRPSYDITKLGQPKATAIQEPIDPVTQSPIVPLNIRNRMKGRSALLVPATLNLGPEALTAHAKRNYTAEKLDPFAISPDENLREINRLTDASIQSLDYLPIGMRGAANANTISQAIEGSNQAISGANQFNAQNRQQTEVGNVNLENNARLLNYNEIPRYEALQLTAVAKTLNDYHNYFNVQQSNQINRYNYITSAGIIDSMFDNVGYDPFGRPEVDSNTFVPFSTI